MNLTAAGQRFGSINGVSVEGLFDPSLVVNFALATRNQAYAVNLELLGGVNVAGRVSPLDPSAAFNTGTPVSGRFAVGVGFTRTIGHHALSAEFTFGREVGSTVGPSMSATDPTVGPAVTGSGATTFGINLSYSQINPRRERTPTF